MTSEITFNNSSFYFVPIRFDKNRNKRKDAVKDSALVSYLSESSDWECIKNESADYLFSYASKIMTDAIFCMSFEYQKTASLDVYMFEKHLEGIRESLVVEMNEKPTLERIRINVFSTGVAFLEFFISYGSNTPEQIINFAYRFKKAVRPNGCPDGTVCLSDAIELLIPCSLGCEPFFANKGQPFSRVCRCLHMLYLPEADYIADKVNIDSFCSLLARSYADSFSGENHEHDKYDRLYSPYEYMHFSASQEGVACVCTKSDNANSRYYIEKIHYSQLAKDYRYMYLILLNQRYSAISYMEQIARRDEDIVCETNDEIINLKTQYSFKVISDDRIYQNLYSNLFEIFEIADFVEDLEQMHEKIGALNTVKNAKVANRTSNFITGISILAISSALIDTATFFERWDGTKAWATYLSMFITAAICGACIAWGYYLYHNKK